VSVSRPCDNCQKGVKVGKRGARVVRCEMCIDRDGRPTYLCAPCRKELGYLTAKEERERNASAIRLAKDDPNTTAFDQWRERAEEASDEISSKQ
jgi:hypothetical protein